MMTSCCQLVQHPKMTCVLTCLPVLPQDAKRLMPKMDIAHTLRTNPEMVLSFQKGKNLIPFDPAWPVQPQT